jgi:D-alanyl-D-alanine carboxypeptidase
MYKKPPEDEEQREYPEIIYPAQKRRRPVVTKKPPSYGFHADEHPEIPQVKRASLYLEKQEDQRSSRAAPVEEVDEYEDEPVIDQKAAQTGEIIVTPYRHLSSSPTYRSRPTTRRSYRTPARTNTRHSHSQNSFLKRLVQLSQSRTVTIIGIIGLILVICVPIARNLNHNPTMIFLSTQGHTTNSQPPAKETVPATAHELVIVPQDTNHPAPPVLATSAYLLDADTGVTLYAYNPFMHLPMLSTTKLMTASLAIEHGNLDQQITITAAMSKEINQLSADSALFGIKQGETYSLRDLLFGLLFVSGNDAAIAIADALGGNLPNFVAQMNQKAHQLGMYDTHFVNPHGLLDPEQYSCAHDLAILGRYSVSLPVLHNMSGQNAYHIPAGGNHPERFLINENQFMWWYPGVDGGKTGYDGAKDFIQIMSVTRNHHHLIGVVMHTNDWWTDMRDLMNWGFDSFTWISPRDVDLNQHPIPFDYLWNYFARDKKDTTIPTAGNGRYYIYTGFSISGPIMAYFDKHGGLSKFGYPAKLPVASGAQIISQRFEHGTIQCNTVTNLCQNF